VVELSTEGIDRQWRGGGEFGREGDARRRKQSGGVALSGAEQKDPGGGADAGMASAWMGRPRNAHRRAWDPMVAGAAGESATDGGGRWSHEVEGRGLVRGDLEPLDGSREGGE